MKIIIKTFLCFFIVCTIVGCSSENNKVEEEPKEEGIIEQVEEIPTNVEGSGSYLNAPKIPVEFGVAQYTTEEIRTFKDCSAEELKNKINSISDFVQWIIENDFANPEGIRGDFKYRFGDYMVSLNRSPEGTIRLQSGSCGSISNLARYVLEDDYDYVGFIMQGESENNEPYGGHVYNYFMKDGKILTYDFTSPIHYKEFGRMPGEARMEVLNDISEIRHGSEGSTYLYRVVATKDWNKDHPTVIFEEVKGGKGGRCYFFDSIYKDNLVVIWDDEEHCKLLSENSDYVYHDLFEDVDYDPNTIPYDVMDYEYVEEMGR